MKRSLAALAAVLLIVACAGGTTTPTPAPVTAPPTTSAPVATPTAAAPSAAETAAASMAPSAPASAAAESMAPSPAGSMAASPAPSEGAQPSASIAAASPGASAGGTNTWAAGISGPVTISGWQSSPAEGNALTQTLLGAQSALPTLQISYQPIAGDYVAAMTADFAAHSVPDLFYVDASYAQEWIKQGFLLPLDDYISKASFDASQFFPAAAQVFKGTDGKTYGFPKDFNTIATAYNTSLVQTPPTTLDDLITLAKSLKGKNGLMAPICLNPGLDRGLAFLYAQGGSLLNSDNSAEAIDTVASKAAVQWYMDLFKQGLGMTASDMGDGWCGDSLGKKHAAITFEGGWLDPSMTSTYPDVKYAWAPFPTGSSGSPVTISYTVSYSIGADSANPDQAFALATYLTGPVGMKLWTEGGVALPSRSDVPIPQGKDVLSQESQYAKPGSGFMPGYNDVQKAFQDAFTNQLQTKGFDAGPVVSATKDAIDKALATQ